LKSFNLVLQLFNSFVLVSIKSKSFILSLNPSYLLVEVINLFLELSNFLGKLFLLKHVLPLSLISGTVFLLALAEKDALLLKLEFSFVFSLL